MAGTQPKTAESEARPVTPVSILVVDDDTTKRFALRAILASLDETVVEASSGADALRQLLRQEFAVILLDVRMPIMDGFETAQLIRQRPSSELTPIIFVTALDQSETDLVKGYDLGAVDFVFSPVVPEILRAKVAVFAELYRAQQELRRYRSRLEFLVSERTTALTAINRELEAFSSSISRDLREPLLAVDSLTKTLADEYGEKLDKRGKESLQRLRRASDRMSAVFDGLQALFRLTGGEIRRETLNISNLATEVVRDIRKDEPGREVEVKINEGVTASGDRRLVKVLISSLIDNAWKFTRREPKPRIEVGMEIVDGESRMYVRDNGVGFDMIYAHRLFGAFQRLHSQSEFPGAGIGLATARRIAHRHGGRVWAEGAVGEGATFYFVI